MQNNQKRQSILAIDPGVSGGFAYRFSDGVVRAFPMPDGMTEQIDQIRGLAKADSSLKVIIENVGGYQPGNSGPAAVKFGRHIGNLEGAIYALGIPILRPVVPQVWQKIFGALPRGAEPAAKRARKNAIKEKVQREFPHLKVTLKTADALGILMWALEIHPPAAQEFEWL